MVILLHIRKVPNFYSMQLPRCAAYTAAGFGWHGVCVTAVARRPCAQIYRGVEEMDYPGNCGCPPRAHGIRSTNGTRCRGYGNGTFGRCAVPCRGVVFLQCFMCVAVYDFLRASGVCASARKIRKCGKKSWVLPKS